MKPVVVAPSVLAADFRRRYEEVNAVDLAGADWIHIDVMDDRLLPAVRPVGCLHGFIDRAGAPAGVN